MISALFVCTGNICRSPMAEAVFAHLVEQAGLSDKIAADSAGTISYHTGERTHSGTLRVLAEHGIRYEGRSRGISRQDLDRFDYVLALDHEHLQDIQALGKGRAKVSLLMDYAPGQAGVGVPDPYYSGRFREVYEMVLTSSQGLLAAIRQEHGL